MGSSMIYVLVLVGYNSLSHQVETAAMMGYFLSHGDCRNELEYQNRRGRKETYNRNYVCLPVNDAEIRARLKRERGERPGLRAGEVLK